ncbi:MAG: hypothetical protein LKI82_01080 [Clostridium sp.]|uniref:hypothetical protein n=1 Tax=Clostridium sp. TaxID=1506 RepID=UPI0025C0B65F|nr:hypothetical protein [Clostridium sp.]MCI1869498.1 hypothetical protein [Clostridium sp.]
MKHSYTNWPVFSCWHFQYDIFDSAGLKWVSLADQLSGGKAEHIINRHFVHKIIRQSFYTTGLPYYSQSTSEHAT